jgi:hypothetical protein
MILELDNLARNNMDMFIEFMPDGTATAGTIRLMERNGRTLEVACPTATEPYYIIERDDTYGVSTVQRNG